MQHKMNTVNKPVNQLFETIHKNKLRKNQFAEKNLTSGYLFNICPEIMTKCLKMKMKTHSTISFLRGPISFMYRQTPQQMN